MRNVYQWTQTPIVSENPEPYKPGTNYSFQDDEFKKLLVAGGKFRFIEKFSPNPFEGEQISMAITCRAEKRRKGLFYYAYGRNQYNKLKKKYIGRPDKVTYEKLFQIVWDIWHDESR